MAIACICGQRHPTAENACGGGPIPPGYSLTSWWDEYNAAALQKPTAEKRSSAKQLKMVSAVRATGSGQRLDHLVDPSFVQITDNGSVEKSADGA